MTTTLQPQEILRVVAATRIALDALTEIALGSPRLAPDRAVNALEAMKVALPAFERRNGKERRINPTAFKKTPMDRRQEPRRAIDRQKATPEEADRIAKRQKIDEGLRPYLDAEAERLGKPPRDRSIYDRAMDAALGEGRN